jgi:hypothetical protein
MTWDSVRAREAEFGRRIAALFGVDPGYVLDASAEETRTEAGVERRTVTVTLVRTVTQEEALRLRYGDDVEITRTPKGGWDVRIPVSKPDDLTSN